MVLSPVLTLVFLLDARSLSLARLAARGARAQGARQARGCRSAVIALRGGDALLGRRRARAGRSPRCARRCAGRSTSSVDWVREHEPEPERLVIATNYEEQALMYYLGSRVIVGLALNNLAEDRELEPDLVIPRRRWRSSLPEAVAFLRRGEWERVRFRWSTSTTTTSRRSRARASCPIRIASGRRFRAARTRRSRSTGAWRARRAPAPRAARRPEAARRLRRTARTAAASSRRLAGRADHADALRAALGADLEAHERVALQILPARERRVLERRLDPAPDLGQARLDAGPVGARSTAERAPRPRRRVRRRTRPDREQDQQRGGEARGAHFHDTVTPPS